MHRKIFRLIAAISKALWLPVALAAGIAIFRAFLYNYGYVIFQELIDRFAIARQFSDLTPLLAAYIGINLFNHTLIYAEGYADTVLYRGVIQAVKLRTLEKIARIDYLAYQNLGTGNLIQIIENGSEAIRKILGEFYIENLVGVVRIAVSLYFIQTYDQTLFLVILGLYGVFYLSNNYLMRFLQNALEKLLASQEDFSKFSVRAFMELVVFRINGRFKAEYERLKGISDEMIQARSRVYLLQELSYTGMALLIFLVEAGVVVQQSGKILAGQSTVGTMVALISFVQQVFWPVVGFGRSWLGYKMNAQTYSHLDQVLALPDDPGMQMGRFLAVTGGRIVFEKVSFAYPGQGLVGQGWMEQTEVKSEVPESESIRQGVLEDFSLEVEAGKTTAIVGSSGGGKSTLLRLLLFLIKPQQGRILVDNQDLAQVQLESYYQQVAYIPQEPPIFDGTLRENLTFNHAVPAGRLAEVLCLVGLDGLVKKLPLGLETVVGERGIKLSGGERQRLAFGRVMLQEPQIVILDEPTAALDSLTEAQVTGSLMAFLRGKTVIIVAHRLQTVREADRIIVLEEGRIVQEGQFDGLIVEEGPFRRLWEKQVREREVDALEGTSPQTA